MTLWSEEDQDKPWIKISGEYLFEQRILFLFSNSFHKFGDGLLVWFSRVFFSSKKELLYDSVQFLILENEWRLNVDCGPRETIIQMTRMFHKAYRLTTLAEIPREERLSLRKKCSCANTFFFN